jgi:transcription initiation factor TFIID subunit 1
MLVGQRFLEDAGYGAAEDDGNMADADSKLELEQQLAPWIATKNFINAAQVDNYTSINTTCMIILYLLVD